MLRFLIFVCCVIGCLMFCWFCYKWYMILKNIFFLSWMMMKLILVFLNSKSGCSKRFRKLESCWGVLMVFCLRWVVRVMFIFSLILWWVSFCFMCCFWYLSWWLMVLLLLLMFLLMSLLVWCWKWVRSFRWGCIRLWLWLRRWWRWMGSIRLLCIVWSLLIMWSRVVFSWGCFWRGWCCVSWSMMSWDGCRIGLCRLLVWRGRGSCGWRRRSIRSYRRGWEMRGESWIDCK